MAEIEEPMRSLEDRLRDIRISKSQTQNGNRTILDSIDATLKENNEKQTSTSYFVSLLSVLELFTAEDDAQNLTSTMYLLDLVAPHVSKPLLQGKFDDIATKLINTLAYEKAEAPLLRSSIGFIKTILLAQDFATWQHPRGACRALMEALIQLGVDQRPKVRKEAQSIITVILKTPPSSPKLEHPAGAYCARDSLTLVQKAFTSLPKGGKDHKQAISDLTHALSLAKSVTLANCWPVDYIDNLCKVMLEICRTKEEFLVTSAFGILETIFSSIQDESAESKFVKCLETILELQPSHNDVNIAPVWLGAVAQAGGAYAAFQPHKALSRLPSLFETVAAFLESENQSVQTSAAQCLVALATTAIDDEVLLLANKTKSTEKVLAQICKTVYGMLDIKYISAWNETMEVLIALYRKLRWRANPHLVDALKVIAALRTVESSADRRESTDRAIGEAIAALGPEVVLQSMPLNLQEKNGGRAWLLPLLRDNIVYAKLGFFISEFVPLGEWLKQKSEELEIEAGSDDKGPLAMQGKIYSTLFEQVWSLLPRFMTLPFDLKESFTNEFGETLGQQMYEEPQLRHLICNSFSLMIESNEVHSTAEDQEDELKDILLLERFPAKAASDNIKYIAENFSQKIMPMLFNVFMNTKSEQRSYVLECLEHFLRITPDAAIASAFTEVFKFLTSELEKETEAKQSKGKSKFDNSMLISFLDIVIVLAVYLPEQSMDDLAQIFSTFVSRQDEPLLQKKAFRIISSMSKSEIGSKYIRSHISVLESKFIEFRQKVGQSARAARLQAVSVLIEALPNDHLAFISSILPETILSTTAQNEKTRAAAFNLLLEMAEKMKAGGQIDMTQIPGMGDDDAGVSEASLSEYIMMACGGLVSEQISMISATVAALSRLVFEFRDEMDVEILEKLIDLVNPLLRGKSQEVAKITLGFTKIVISLPSELIEPQLGGLIESMLVWSHGSKCRSRVKHIIQRLNRRFGYEKMKEVFPEKDIKLLENIRKSRERAKRQAAAGKEQTSGTVTSKTSKYDNEFERQLYGSSDEESSDEDEQPAKKGERYIVEGEDEPMDLLDSKSMARISSSKPKQQKGARTLKNKFGKDQSGKIIVKEQNSDDEIDLDRTGGIDAYQQAVKAGPVKGQRGRLKYKRSRKHQEDSDDESDAEASSKKQASSSKTQNRPRKQLPKRRKL